MRRSGPIAAVVLLAWSVPAMAQDPCQRRPGDGALGANDPSNPQRAQACAYYLQQQRTLSDNWLAQQRAQAAARQLAAQEAAAAEARRDAAARAQAQKRAAERAKAAREAQEAAENSPDNKCREPKTAGATIQKLNSWRDWRRTHLEVVDMEHVTTPRFDPDGNVLTCHVTLVFTNARRQSGTLELRPNIAGDMIYTWKAD